MPWIPLILIGAAILFVAYQLKKTAKKPVAAPPFAGPEPTPLKRIQRGDFVSISHRGGQYEDLEFEVLEINRYESGELRWNELAGQCKGERLHVEIYEDDQLQIALSYPKNEQPLAILGLTEDDLIRFDETGAGRPVRFEGREYHFQRSGEIGYYKDGQGAGEGYFSWEFLTADRKHRISIEKWEGEAFRFLPSEVIPESEIQVFGKGA